MSETKYHSLCTAAPGWWAIYKDKPENIFSPVAFWAVVVKQTEDGYGGYDGEEFLRGFDVSGGWSGESCEDVGNFLEYEYDPDRRQEKYTKDK